MWLACNKLSIKADIDNWSCILFSLDSTTLLNVVFDYKNLKVDLNFMDNDFLENSVRIPIFIYNFFVLFFWRDLSQCETAAVKAGHLDSAFHRDASTALLLNEDSCYGSRRDYSYCFYS